MSILDTYSFILQYIQPTCTGYSNKEFDIKSKDYAFANSSTTPSCSSVERLKSVDSKNSVFPCPYTFASASVFSECSFYVPNIELLKSSNLVVPFVDSSVNLDLIKYTSLNPGKTHGYLICNPLESKIFLCFAADKHDDLEAFKVYDLFVKDFSYNKYFPEEIPQISVDEKPKNISYLNSLLGVS
jgi:hypothetical protein